MSMTASHRKNGFICNLYIILNIVKFQIFTIFKTGQKIVHEKMTEITSYYLHNLKTVIKHFHAKSF